MAIRRNRPAISLEMFRLGLPRAEFGRIQLHFSVMGLSALDNQGGRYFFRSNRPRFAASRR